MVTRRALAPHLFLLVAVLAGGTIGFAKEMPRSKVVFKEYKVLFDRNKEGYAVAEGTVAFVGRELLMVFMGNKVVDSQAGTFPRAVYSNDFGKTWSQPKLFGIQELSRAGLNSIQNQSLFMFLFGPTKIGTVLALGEHLARGVRTGVPGDLYWRPSSLVVGRREKGQSTFSYREYPSGTFLGEQFPGTGLISSTGRIFVQLWGAKHRGENWQCGVLISDDDGRTWHYRTVGYDPDLSIRDNPKMPAGFNEQTLFETKDGEIVSIIRGRDKLGQVAGSPDDTWFFRSVSKDQGETWSKPQLTDLAGTGASRNGLTLPDGSLLLICRVPYSRTLYPLKEKKLFGFHVVRSYDEGKTWHTELIEQRAPDGGPFDWYYSCDNGQFLPIGKNKWLYIFAQNDRKKDIYRMLSLELQVQ